MGIWKKLKMYLIDYDKRTSKIQTFQKYEECWGEMWKHQPFGWVKNKNSNEYISIASVYCSNEKKVRIEIFPRLSLSAEHAYNQFEFPDSTLFGIKEE